MRVLAALVFFRVLQLRLEVVNLLLQMLILVTDVFADIVSLVDDDRDNGGHDGDACDDAKCFHCLLLRQVAESKFLGCSDITAMFGQVSGHLYRDRDGERPQRVPRKPREAVDDCDGYDQAFPRGKTSNQRRPRTGILRDNRGEYVSPGVELAPGSVGDVPVVDVEGQPVDVVVHGHSLGNSIKTANAPLVTRVLGVLPRLRGRHLFLQ